MTHSVGTPVNYSILGGFHLSHTDSSPRKSHGFFLLPTWERISCHLLQMCWRVRWQHSLKQARMCDVLISTFSSSMNIAGRDVVTISNLSIYTIPSPDRAIYLQPSPSHHHKNCRSSLEGLQGAMRGLMTWLKLHTDVVFVMSSGCPGNAAWWWFRK